MKITSKSVKPNIKYVLVIKYTYLKEILNMIKVLLTIIILRNHTLRVDETKLNSNLHLTSHSCFDELNFSYGTMTSRYFQTI